MSEKIVNIINPAAGQGIIPTVADGETYRTVAIGDAAEYTEKLCRSTDGPLLLRVYGGDGTIGEVATGMIRSGRTDSVRMTIVPTGTGNDFVRSFEKGSGERLVDAMKINDRYAVNMANTGFDCRVVVKASELKKKPLISGSLAYVLGVVQVLCGRIGEEMKIEYTDANDVTHTVEGSMLLVLAANAKYYGGGFMAAPLADPCDGLLDMLIVPKMSQLRFISLVSAYKSGKHLDPTTLQPIDRFKKYMTFVRIKRMKISGLELACADGEVKESESMEISVVPKALRVVF